MSNLQGRYYWQREARERGVGGLLAVNLIGVAAIGMLLVCYHLGEQLRLQIQC